jgi:uncharacterized membrane protein HdeD (DUF308 family)
MKKDEMSNIELSFVGIFILICSIILMFFLPIVAFIVMIFGLFYSLSGIIEQFMENSK